MLTLLINNLKKRILQQAIKTGKDQKEIGIIFFNGKFYFTKEREAGRCHKENTVHIIQDEIIIK